MAKKRFRAKPNKYQDKNQQALNERNDDQIAPLAASHSIDALQRWALATANIAQSGYRANEAEMIDRVSVRYGIQTPSLSANIDNGLLAELAKSDLEMYTESKKRGQPISHAGFSDRTTTVSYEGIEEDLHQAKRCRLKASGDEYGEMSDRYATSGEWNLASENKVETSNKAANTRTFIDLTED